ncbi:MAG: hypothetical protein ACXWKM_11485 [Phenylobacterium sp.]
MLLWILLIAGIALLAMSAWLVLAMSRAERRARRSLYRSLGLAEATVEFLMERNRDVLTELSYVRQDEAALNEAVQTAPPRQTGLSIRPNLRLVRSDPDALLPGERPAASNDRPTHH